MFSAFSFDLVPVLLSLLACSCTIAALNATQQAVPNIKWADFLLFLQESEFLRKSPAEKQVGIN